jgi:hypothetical protein
MDRRIAIQIYFGVNNRSAASLKMIEMLLQEAANSDLYCLCI